MLFVLEREVSATQSVQFSVVSRHFILSRKSVAFSREWYSEKHYCFFFALFLMALGLSLILPTVAFLNVMSHGSHKMFCNFYMNLPT
jgi:hypothetical protein